MVGMAGKGLVLAGLFGAALLTPPVNLPGVDFPGAGSGGHTAGLAVDLSRYTLTFADEFDSFDRRSAAHPEGRWDTSFVRFNARRLPDNKEVQVYMDPDYAGDATAPLGVDPFSVKDGVLTIAAAPADPVRVRPYLKGMTHTSGMISTERSFAQRYGYFEIRARLPVGRGLWPAFWMLSTSGRWPPEIDVFENVGDPETLHMSSHHPILRMGSTAVSPDVGHWHTYGVAWDAETITWTLDGHAVFRQPNLVHEPMYLIANLAVGGAGSWPGPTNAATPVPARLEIDYIRAYAPQGTTVGAAGP